MNSSNTILLVTHILKYEQITKRVLSNYPQYELLVTHHIEKAITIIKEKTYILILLDTMFRSDNPETFNFLCSYILKHRTELNTLLIVPQLNSQTLSKYINIGFIYIADPEMLSYTIPPMLKYCKILNVSHTSRCICYKSITIHIDQNYFIFQNCKIFLSLVEINLLACLTQNEEYTNVRQIKEYLLIKLDKNISTSYISLSITRINYKSFQVTGLKIIRNKYRVGYYLNI